MGKVYAKRACKLHILHVLSSSKDVVVRLNNGKEIVESRNDVLIYD